MSCLFFKQNVGLLKRFGMEMYGVCCATSSGLACFPRSRRRSLPKYSYISILSLFFCGFQPSIARRWQQRLPNSTCHNLSERKPPEDAIMKEDLAECFLYNISISFADVTRKVRLSVQIDFCDDASDNKI